MLKRFRPVSLILLVGALGFSGNLYATPMSGIPRVDISQQNAKVSGIVEDALGPVTGASRNRERNYQWYYDRLGRAFYFG